MGLGAFLYYLDVFQKGGGLLNCNKRQEMFKVLDKKLEEVLKELEPCNKCKFIKSSDKRIIDRVVEAKKLVGLERGLMKYGMV